MTKLIIDERDVRCTILEGVRQLLGEFQITEVDGNMNRYAEEITKSVLACGDPVDRKLSKYNALCAMERARTQLRERARQCDDARDALELERLARVYAARCLEWIAWFDGSEPEVEKRQRWSIEQDLPIYGGPTLDSRSTKR